MQNSNLIEESLKHAMDMSCDLVENNFQITPVRTN